MYRIIKIGMEWLISPGTNSVLFLNNSNVPKARNMRPFKSLHY